MVSYYTAKVARGHVVIHDVDLPNGTTVSVQIEPAVVVPPFRTREEVEADLRASDAEFRRGEWISGEEAIAALRRHVALLDSGQRSVLELKRAKPASKRAR